MSKEPTVTFTLNEINAVLAELGEIPAKYSKSLIDKIQAFAGQQLQSQADSESTEDEGIAAGN